MLQRIKNLIKPALMGGLVVLLPSFLLINILIWLSGVVNTATLPMVRFISNQLELPLWVSQAMVLLLILFICLFTGLLIQNRLGAFLINRTESLILNRFPGYQSLKELVGYFLSPEKKSAFSQPVLACPWGDDTWLTAFLVDGDDVLATVFVPTGPNPSTGLILHIPREKIRPLNVSSSDAFKSVIGCGVGSSAFYRNK